MIEVMQVCKIYNANFACYENLTKLYKYDLIFSLFSNLLNSHQLSEYLNLNTLFNISSATILNLLSLSIHFIKSYNF